VPLERWQRVVRQDSHGKESVHYVVELELGNAHGPRRNWRLIAATTLPLQEASPREVYETYTLRDWIEHYYKPVKHELGWADFQTRDAAAIIRHWHLVMLAFTFSLLTEAPPAGWVRTAEPEEAVGKNQDHGSSGRRRCAASGHGSVRGPRSAATGRVGRTRHHRNCRPSWHTWPTLDPLMPQPDHPATKHKAV
jgi:hypothetical protein